MFSSKQPFPPGSTTLKIFWCLRCLEETAIFIPSLIYMCDYNFQLCAILHSSGHADKYHDKCDIYLMLQLSFFPSSLLRVRDHGQMNQFSPLSHNNHTLYYCSSCPISDVIRPVSPLFTPLISDHWCVGVEALCSDDIVHIQPDLYI